MHTEEREGRVKLEKLLDTGRCKEWNFCWCVWRKCSSTGTLILTFWPPEPCKNKGVVLSQQVWGNLLQKVQEANPDGKAKGIKKWSVRIIHDLLPLFFPSLLITLFHASLPPTLCLFPLLFLHSFIFILFLAIFPSPLDTQI